MQEGPTTTAAVSSKSATSVPLWSRSVGSMKCQLSGLVRPKTTSQSTAPSTAVTCQEIVTQTNSSGTEVTELDSKSSCKNNGPNTSEQSTSGGNSVSAGLAGLGAYSSSSGSDNDEEAV